MKQFNRWGPVLVTIAMGVAWLGSAIATWGVPEKASLCVLSAAFVGICLGMSVTMTLVNIWLVRDRS